jgi:hypothetical protein
MSALGMVIVGVILLTLAYFLPQMPPPVRTVLNILGTILLIVGAILLVFSLFGGVRL